MNDRSKKLQHRQSEEEQSASADSHGKSAPAPIEFASAEELIRHDAAHTEVPAGVTARLQKSAAATSSESKPWWRRMLGQ